MSELYCVSLNNFIKNWDSIFLLTCFLFFFFERSFETTWNWNDRLLKTNFYDWETICAKTSAWIKIEICCCWENWDCFCDRYAYCYYDIWNENNLKIEIASGCFFSRRRWKVFWKDFVSFCIYARLFKVDFWSKFIFIILTLIEWDRIKRSIISYWTKFVLKKMKKLIEELKVFKIELIMKELVMKLMTFFLNDRTASSNFLNSIMIKFIWKLFLNIIILKYNCFYVKRDEESHVKNL